MGAPIGVGDPWVLPVLAHSSYATVRTADTKLSTSLEQLVTTLLILSDLLQGCSNKSDTVMI
jgi:hypothetical protein